MKRYPGLTGEGPSAASFGSIFAAELQNGRISINKTVLILLVEWFVFQPAFIRSVFPEFLKYIGSDEGEDAVLAAIYRQ